MNSSPTSVLLAAALARISHSGNVGLLKGTALASVHDAGRDGPI
jgi:hypothetical protein